MRLPGGLGGVEMQDLRITDDGDLVLSEDGDLDICEEHDFVMQQIKYRLKSNKPEIFMNSSICADLFELRGWPNTRETADEGTRRILRALTIDGLLDANDIYIEAHPTSPQMITWFVFINSGNGEPDGLIVDLNFNRGVLVRGVRE